MKLCEKCSTEISVYSRYCPEHAAEVRRAKDSARKRQQYANGEAYAKVKDAQARQREVKRRYICDYLFSNPCIDCGETDIVVLDFDHKGEVSKTSDVITMMNNGTSLKTMIQEIEKCVVRCANDHRRKTIKLFGNTYRTRYLDEQASYNGIITDFPKVG